jgi:hypothetical protein
VRKVRAGFLVLGSTSLYATFRAVARCLKLIAAVALVNIEYLPLIFSRECEMARNRSTKTAIGGHQCGQDQSEVAGIHRSRRAVIDISRNIASQLSGLDDGDAVKRL